MRVLLVHEYYRERGGEDTAFEADCALLGEAGVDVESLTFHNDELPDHATALGKLQLFASTVWSKRGRQQIEAAIAAIRPDVIHFHNTFPLLSPAVFSAARARGVAVLATVHNYRLLCPNASFYRNGAVCEDCLHAPLPLPGVLHACYRGSRSQTAAVSAMLAFHRARRTWIRDVDTLIAPSEFLRAKLSEGGVGAGKIVVRPNAVQLPPPIIRRRGDYYLYVGRLALNKGIETLLAAWRENEGLPPLRIGGGGELADCVRDTARVARSPVTYLGALGRDEVFEAMAGAQALIVPSIWYENQPLTILEAFASGLPVIASDIGALPELVMSSSTGILFQPGDDVDLAAKVRWAADNAVELTRLGAKARQVFEERYSPERSVETLIGLYETTLANTEVAARARRPGPGALPLAGGGGPRRGDD